MSFSRLSDLPDELYVHILRQVPVESRVRIRTVSREWYNIIPDLGYHIDPDFMDGWYLAPHYSSAMQIKMNPAIDNFNDHRRDSQNRDHSGRIYMRSLK